MASRRKPKTTSLPRGKTLRGVKEVLVFLRITFNVRWHRITLYRRRQRRADPFPGTHRVIQQRLLFITTDTAVVRWARRNLEAPMTDLEQP